MRNVRMTICLMAAVVFFVTCQAYAGIFDDFNNGHLDPAWGVTFQNANGWAHVESGTKLSVYDVNTLNSSENYSDVLLWQNFSAPGDFVIKSVISWDSELKLLTMQNLTVRALSGDKIVALGGYTDGWINGNGGKNAKIEYPFYAYDSGKGTLPDSGTTEIILKRTSGTTNIIWNGELVLTGYSDSVVDKVAILFEKDNTPGGNFGVLSVDYVNAVPEPATILLFSIGSCCVLSRRKRI
jgi:hypothetical protein